MFQLTLPIYNALFQNWCSIGLTVTSVSKALVAVVAAARVRSDKVDTDGVVAADVGTFRALVDVDVTVAARPPGVLTRRTTGNDVARSVGSAATQSPTVYAPTTGWACYNITPDPHQSVNQSSIKPFGIVVVYL